MSFMSFMCAHALRWPRKRSPRKALFLDVDGEPIADEVAFLGTRPHQTSRLAPRDTAGSLEGNRLHPLDFPEARVQRIFGASANR